MFLIWLFKKKKTRLFHKNDLLFVGIGTIGKVGIVSKEIVASNQQITGITVNEDILMVEYLYYYLKYNNDIVIADQSKTTLAILNQEKIKQIPIVVPPIAIQKQVVGMLSDIDNKQERLREEIRMSQAKSLAEFEQTIFE